MCEHKADGVLRWRLYASDRELLWCGRCGAIASTALGVPVAGAPTLLEEGDLWNEPSNPPHVLRVPSSLCDECKRVGNAACIHARR